MDIIQNDPEIKKANDKYEEFLSNEQLQDLYLAREIHKHDQASMIGAAEDRGKSVVIRTLFNKGYTAEQIAEMTDIEKDDINKILDNDN